MSSFFENSTCVIYWVFKLKISSPSKRYLIYEHPVQLESKLLFEILHMSIMKRFVEEMQLESEDVLNWRTLASCEHLSQLAARVPGCPGH